MKRLIIDCCIREKESGTKLLLDNYLKDTSGDNHYLNLMKLDLKPLNINDLKYRDECLINKKNDKIFDLAKDFVTYDEIVIAAPYWDLSFPSLLKVYFEHISVVGITFTYQESIPIGLSKAERMIYLSTCGGKIQEHLGYLYTKKLMEMFGIKKSYNFYIDSLDLDLNKRNSLLDEGIKNIKLQMQQLGLI